MTKRNKNIKKLVTETKHQRCTIHLKTPKATERPSAVQNETLALQA